MIVYGEPGHEEPLESIVTSLREGLDRVLSSDSVGRDASGDALRRLLIQAGEVEQAVYDAPSSLGTPEARRRAMRSFRAATSFAAKAFHHACESPDPPGEGLQLVRKALERMRRALDGFRNGEAVHGRVWMDAPEGFALHALFPERYREAAWRWAEEHAEDADRDLVVVGIRGIGTSLSAVVATALRERGFRARRITVRPNGSPDTLDRQLRKIGSAPRGLVVENPRPSGAASQVVDALARAGIPSVDRLQHDDSDPGSGRLGRLGVAEALWGSVLGESGDPLARVLECERGAWRSIHYDGKTSWPATCSALERTKLLCEGGSGRRVLFKFIGLATAPGSTSSVAEVHARQLGRLAKRGWTPAPLGTAHGFVAMEWLDGRPLAASDPPPDHLRRMGSYIAEAAGPPLSSSAAQAARARLETMLCANAREALGDAAGDAATSLLRPIPVLEAMPRSGDGHMAPHEWIATRERGILKVDAGGHDLDPTWTGRQPILWDLAGALLEWDLDESGTAELLEGFTAAGGERCAKVALGAYGAAYAAHRMGQARLCADLEGNPEERSRLEADYERWRDALASRLNVRRSEESRS